MDLIINNPYFNELKDKRLNLLHEQNIEGIMLLEYELIPDYSTACPKCGSNIIIKYGTYTRKIRQKIFQHSESIIILKVHKFKCCQCSTIFSDKYKELSGESPITNTVKLHVLLDFKKDISVAEIARRNGISWQCAQNIFDTNIKIERFELDEVLCFDEFKNLKKTEGKYAFLMYAPMNDKVIDVLPTRRQDKLREYIIGIPPSERYRVKYIVTDMNESYRSIIKDFFPSATHVVDSFHYVRLVTKAFNDIRTQVQNSFSCLSWKYKMLKNNWRTLLMDTRKITCKELYNHKQKRKTSISEYLTDALTIDPRIDEAFSLLQDFYDFCKNTKYEEVDEAFDKIINLFNNSSLDKFREVAKTLVSWRKEISNSFIRFGDKRLNNGYIEGMNNLIKVIKRVAYGYRNFDNFRNRIMFIKNEEFPTKIKIK